MCLSIGIIVLGLFMQDLKLTMKEGMNTTFIEKVTGLLDFKIFKQFMFWALIILFFFFQLGKTCENNYLIACLFRSTVL